MTCGSPKTLILTFQCQLCNSDLHYLAGKHSLRFQIYVSISVNLTDVINSVSGFLNRVIIGDET